jgi:radical SAM enzyme (TIGR01210 family)
MVTDLPTLSDQQIVSLRPQRNSVDPLKPYAFMVEEECSASGELTKVATVFLTSSECTFRCTMCDLWKNTLEQPVEPEAIGKQIRWALNELEIDRAAPGRQGISAIKLYNSGNFFDNRAVPRSDWPEIAELVAGFESVIVENHPRLCKQNCLEFKSLLAGRLEIAMGLETVHPQVLQWLNKQMSLEDFQEATHRLISHDINVRAFVLLRPPFLTEQEGVHWATKTMEYAFECGVECCSLVPVRGGNGVLDQLQKRGDFTPPNLKSMESALVAGLGMKRGRVFMDLWDVQRFVTCHRCSSDRQNRILQMNQTQTVIQGDDCGDCG